MKIPARLNTREVLALVGVSQTTWNRMRAEGRAPGPKYRSGDGMVYLGRDIEKFFGMVDEPEISDYDPILRGIEAFGKARGQAGR